MFDLYNKLLWEHRIHLTFVFTVRCSRTRLSSLNGNGSCRIRVEIGIGSLESQN